MKMRNCCTSTEVYLLTFKLNRPRRSLSENALSAEISYYPILLWFDPYLYYLFQIWVIQGPARRWIPPSPRLTWRLTSDRTISPLATTRSAQSRPWQLQELQAFNLPRVRASRLWARIPSLPPRLFPLATDRFPSLEVRILRRSFICEVSYRFFHLELWLDLTRLTRPDLTELNYYTITIFTFLSVFVVLPSQRPRGQKHRFA